jgi:hypothetical protein
MPPEIDALFDKPQLLLAVLATGAFIGVSVERFTSKMRRRVRRARNRER